MYMYMYAKFPKFKQCFGLFNSIRLLIDFVVMHILCSISCHSNELFIFSGWKI